MIPELERRRLATNKTIERYQGKAFSWGKGITCVHLCRFHLRNMAHKPVTIPRFRSLIGARAALKERGWDSATDMLDSMLPRIPAAAMMIGDVATVEGEGMDAILICVGQQRLFGWHGSEDVPVMIGIDYGEVKAAWRA